MAVRYGWNITPTRPLGHLLRPKFTPSPGADDDVRFAVDHVLGVLDDAFLGTRLGGPFR